MAAPRSRILVTGGAGYIGSHTVVELVNAGYAVTIVDNFSNSSKVSIERMKKLVAHPEWIEFTELDLLDAAKLDAALAGRGFGAVIHFAALKAVGESVSKPLLYYENNIGGLVNLLKAMKTAGIPNIGAGITNPYGMTKHMAEQILKDVHKADPALGVVLLRYFNPVGAHPSGSMGEDPAGIPNNLMPYIQRVASGRLPQLTVYGTDYDTPDGTAQRDYIHVVDLARGHVAAVDWVFKQSAGSPSSAPCEVFNLGTGKPSSVKEVISAFEKACGKPIPHTFGPRREGDVQGSWADADKAASVLGWRAQLSLPEMCRDAWKWVTENPTGYSGATQ